MSSLPASEKAPEPANTVVPEPQRIEIATKGDTANKDPLPAKKNEAAPPPTEGEKKLSAKELKEKKKAEKQARRAQNKEVTAASSVPEPKSQQKQEKKEHGIVKTIIAGKTEPLKGHKGSRPEVHVSNARTEAPAVQHGLIGLLHELELEQFEKKKGRNFSIENASGGVHPAILTLGIQMQQRVVAGATARCLGFLLAIQRVIEDYESPSDQTLVRHLPGQYLTQQINFISHARPMGTAMGNAIRWLKNLISHVDPDLSEEKAKEFIGEKIDIYINERIMAAASQITDSLVTNNYIEDNDVILTYSKSYLVEKAILEACKRGRNVQVIIVDNRQLQEGKNLLIRLVEEDDLDIELEYVQLYALDYVLPRVTKVLLGAHAVLGDGSIYSRAGTSMIASAAEETGIPVFVLAESIKFSERLSLDGLVGNELGDPEELVNTSDSREFPELGYLSGHQEKEDSVHNTNTHLVTFRYDVTPPEHISAVICEHGPINPAGVAAVIGLNATDKSA